MLNPAYYKYYKYIQVLQVLQVHRQKKKIDFNCSQLKSLLKCSTFFPWGIAFFAHNSKEGIAIVEGGGGPYTNQDETLYSIICLY